jgi:hypothetical protein
MKKDYPLLKIVENKRNPVIPTHSLYATLDPNSRVRRETRKEEKLNHGHHQSMIPWEWYPGISSNTVVVVVNIVIIRA